MRRATVGGVGLALGLFFVVIIVVAPPRGVADPVARTSNQQVADHDVGRAERLWGESPTQGTPASNFVPTASGGVWIEGLGTVSHASVDNHFDRLMKQARTSTGGGGGS
jgi:hypothetical protein